ncbi:hypothetical protein [Actinokineospora enzanensis]|uniref:hypothetical protein n=1 Tax=Actinokineospora enzanensis TaxID=155975 RepID=UPI00037EB778|nr:hypothetical protein [Actinokineospora enzanensis]
MRKYYLEGFLAAAGAAASAAVAVHTSVDLLTVVATLLGGVALACLGASLRPNRHPRTVPELRRRPQPRRLGTTQVFGCSPNTTAAVPIQHRIRVRVPHRARTHP